MWKLSTHGRDPQELEERELELELLELLLLLLPNLVRCKISDLIWGKSQENSSVVELGILRVNHVFDHSCFIINTFSSNLPASSWSARTKKRANGSQSLILKNSPPHWPYDPPHPRLMLRCPSSKFRQVCHMWLQYSDTNTMQNKAKRCKQV